jgi:hypothetical protein
LAHVLSGRRIRRLVEEGREAAHHADIVALRIGAQATHRHVFWHALPQRLTGRSTVETGIGSSSPV